MRLIDHKFCYSFAKFLLAAIFCLPGFIYSQPSDLRFERLSTENGLSQNLVFSMVQDKQGFIWFGTDEGLNRFDGYEFKVFKHIASDTTTLADNSVHALMVDRNGILWVGTNNGITQYNPQTEKFKNLPIDYTDNNKLNGTGINTIREDSKGNVWIAYLGSGVDIVTPGKKEIFHYTIHRDEGDPYRLADDYVTAIEFLKGGETLLGTRSGLIILNADGLIVPAIDAINRYPWINKIDRTITCIKLSSDGQTLWFGTESNGVASVYLSTGEVTIYNTTTSGLLFNNNVPALFEDSNHIIWVGGEAIYMLDQKNKILIPFNEFGLRGIIESKNPILSLFEDSDGNIWFGTFRLGVLKYNPRGANVMHYHTGQGQGSLPSNQILSFAEDSNHDLWIGTDGNGLLRLQKDQFTFEIAPLSNTFSSQVIKCIYPDKTGNFWMGTWDGGMMRYNPPLKELEIFNPEKGNLNSRHVWDIQPDRNGDLWLATLRDGLSLYSPQTKTFKHFKNDPTDSTSLVNNDVLAILVDSQNTLWAGTSDGLSVLRSGETKFINRQKKDNITNALCFYEDPLKRMWIGTNGGGIIILNRDLTIAKILSEKDGLLSPTICAMVADKHNNLWVSSYNGLLKIDLNSFSITEIPQSVGLQGKEFIARSALSTPDGRLIFGGVNGFNIIYPDSLVLHPPISKIVLTSLKIGNNEITPGVSLAGRNILSRSISLTDKISLSYADNSFTLSFSPLEFNWQNNIYYSYKLESFDPEWQYTDAFNRTAHYTSLDPGEYVLKIKASFDSKNWPGEARTLTIIVTPPWWATVSFRLFLLVVAVGMLLVLYRGRVNLLKNRQAKLEKLVTERTIELQKSNHEIQELLQEVADQKNEIEEKNHELTQVNDAVVHQRDDLELKTLELEKARHHLMEINTHLEALVDKRTQKLSNTLRELETFLYRASHDLRGPISSMLGILNISEIEKDNEQLKKTYSELFLKTVMQLDRTLQKLLLKHTLERKKLANEHFTKPDLEILLWEISPEIPSFRLGDFATQLEDSINLSIDRLMLRTLLTSLLENAFFYSSRSTDKSVTLDIKQRNGEYIISVSDHGPGVRSDLQEKIFHMFYRGNEFSTGNGLGLYMVKSVLEKINGRVELESEEGCYAIFRVYIPV